MILKLLLALSEESRSIKNHILKYLQILSNHCLVGVEVG